MVTKLIILDLLEANVHVFPIEEKDIVEGGFLNIYKALDLTNKKFGTNFQEHLIDWMFGYDESEVIIHHSFTIN